MTIDRETRFAGDILRVALALPTPSLSPVQAPKRSEFVFSFSVSPGEFLGKVRCLSPVLLPTSHSTPRIPLVFLCSEHLSGLEPSRMALRSVRVRHATRTPTVLPLDIPCSIQLLPPGTQRAVWDREDDRTRIRTRGKINASSEDRGNRSTQLQLLFDTTIRYPTLRRPDRLVSRTRTEATER